MISNWEDRLDGFKAVIDAIKVPNEDRKAMLSHHIGGEVRTLLKKGRC